MDIATTSSVVVRRETKVGTLGVDALRALALTAMKNYLDPDGSATFGEQDATVNPDGSITVTLAIETSTATAPAATPASEPAPSAPAPAMPTLATPIGLAVAAIPSVSPQA